MTKQQTSPERDSEYYRRLGGYQGPVKLTSIQVPCPKCEATHDAPCIGAKGGLIKSFHAERVEWRDTLNDRASADSTTGRWYRHEFREGRIPSAPRPCGTFAAYQRHKRNGDEIDEACHEAARAHWRATKAANRSTEHSRSA